MKVLIIGGTGVISTSITRLLLDRGDEVFHYNRGTSVDVNSNSTVKKIYGDRRDFSAFETQMKGAGYFDCVIDMICFRPDEAESAVRAFKGRVGQFIFTSTTDVYTKKAKKFPIKEDAERKPEPSFPYAYNKAICEDLFFEAHARGDLPVTVIRPHATYSELRMPIVHSFQGGTYHLDRLRKGKPIITHGDGQSIWLECHSDDVGRAFANAAGNRNAFGKAYHVCGEELMTWDTVWKTAAEVMEAPEPKFIHIPSDLLVKVAPEIAGWTYEHFQYNNLFDNTAARTELGFKYTISWKEGFRRYYDCLLRNGAIIEDSNDYPFYDRMVEAWERLSEGMCVELKDIG